MSRLRLRYRMRRAGLSALPVLAGVLMASGFLRLGDGTGQAIATELGALREDVPADTPGCSPDRDVAAVLSALDARAARLEEREAAVAARQAELSKAEATIREQMDAMAAAERELESLIALADSAAEEDLSRLTAVYENMKPKQAAALFAEMAPQFAAGFLGRMRPDAAAGILAGLEPATAYAVSVLLAGRNSQIPTD